MAALDLEAADWLPLLGDSLYSLQRNKVMCDVIIQTEAGDNIPAHLVLLAASSDVMNSMAAQMKRPCNASEPMTIYSSFSTQTWSSLLAFIYTGKLMVEYKLLPEFTTLAKELQIRKLTSLLENAGVHEKLTPLLEKHSSVHAQKRTAIFSDCLRQGSDSGFLVTSTPLKADGVHCFEAGLQGSERITASTLEHSHQELNKETRKSSEDFTTPSSVYKCSLCGSTFQSFPSLILHSDLCTNLGDIVIETPSNDVNSARHSDLCTNLSSVMETPSNDGNSARQCDSNFKSVENDWFAEEVLNEKQFNDETYPDKDTGGGFKRFGNVLSQESEVLDINCVKLSNNEKQDCTLTSADNTNKGIKALPKQRVRKQILGNDKRIVKHKAGTKLASRTGFDCRKCVKFFVNKTSLDNHRRFFHPDASTLRDASSKLHTCEICQKMYRFQSHLRTHMKYDHYKDMRSSGVHRCQLCHKTFGFPTLLRHHLAAHYREFRFQCSKCEKRFLSQHNLDKHCKTHIRVKEYHCKDCHRFFRTKTALNGHFQTCSKEFLKCEDEASKTSSLIYTDHIRIADNNGVIKSIYVSPYKKPLQVPGGENAMNQNSVTDKPLQLQGVCSMEGLKDVTSSQGDDMNIEGGSIQTEDPLCLHYIQEKQTVLVPSSPALTPTDSDLVSSAPVLTPTESDLVLPSSPTLTPTESDLVPSSPTLTPTDSDLVSSAPVLTPTESDLVLPSTPALTPKESDLVLPSSPALTPVESSNVYKCSLCCSTFQSFQSLVLHSDLCEHFGEIDPEIQPNDEKILLSAYNDNDKRTDSRKDDIVEDHVQAGESLMPINLESNGPETYLFVARPSTETVEDNQKNIDDINTQDENLVLDSVDSRHSTNDLKFTSDQVGESEHGEKSLVGKEVVVTFDKGEHPTTVVTNKLAHDENQPEFETGKEALVDDEEGMDYEEAQLVNIDSFIMDTDNQRNEDDENDEDDDGPGNDVKLMRLRPDFSVGVTDDKSHRVTVKTRYCCDICGKTLCSLQVWKDHVKLHSTEKRYECEVCLKTFHTERYLLKHQVLVHERTNKLHVCELCQKTFRVKSHLNTHIKYDHCDDPTSKDLNRCDECQKTFRYPILLKQHMATHSRQLQFVCGTCEKGFSTKHYLDRHLLAHVDIQPWYCEHCNHKFKYKSSLAHHVQTTCAVVAPKVKAVVFVCQICEKSFSENKNLTAHVKHVHLGEKRFQCQVCERAFSRKSSLNAHINKIHNPAKDEATANQPRPKRNRPVVKNTKKVPKIKTERLDLQIGKENETLPVLNMLNKYVKIQPRLHDIVEEGDMTRIASPPAIQRATSEQGLIRQAANMNDISTGDPHTVEITGSLISASGRLEGIVPLAEINRTCNNNAVEIYTGGIGEKIEIIPSDDILSGATIEIPVTGKEEDVLSGITITEEVTSLPLITVTSGNVVEFSPDVTLSSAVSHSGSSIAVTQAIVSSIPGLRFVSNPETTSIRGTPGNGLCSIDLSQISDVDIDAASGRIRPITIQPRDLVEHHQSTMSTPQSLQVYSQALQHLQCGRDSLPRLGHPIFVKSLSSSSVVITNTGPPTASDCGQDDPDDRERNDLYFVDQSNDLSILNATDIGSDDSYIKNKIDYSLFSLSSLTKTPDAEKLD